MAKNHDSDLFERLRSRGVRKKLAKPIGALDGNVRRGGSKGEKLARQAVDDLTSAADEIRGRVLRTDRKRSNAGRKAGQTRKRNAARRKTSAKKGAATRAKVARTRSKAKGRARRS